MFSDKFTIFINRALKILLILIILGSSGLAVKNLLVLSTNNVLQFLLVSFCLFFFSTVIGCYIYRNYREENNKKILLIILLLAFLLRLSWILLMDTPPSSDFRVIYMAGKSFIEGNYNAFRGTAYIARFPHLTIPTLYLGIMQLSFKNGLLAIKLINVVLSTLNVYLIYILTAEIYESRRKGIGASLIAALFTPFIIYNSTICSENVAMTFFIISTYIFLTVVKGKRNVNWLILSGVILSIGNLFRMVGYIILIAYVMYLVIYKLSINVFKEVMLIILAFLIPLYATDALLLKCNITQYHLWKGSEPNITSILKGTNVESYGKWTKEDTELFHKYNRDYDATDKAAKEIIKKRLTQTRPDKLLRLYLVKYVEQWSIGDFSALYWSREKVENNNMFFRLSSFIDFYTQIFYTLMMILIYRGMFNKKQYMNNRHINLMYIIFCGYGLFYLMIEMQSRYAFIASWIFVILAFSYDGKLLPNKLSKHYKKFRSE